MMGKWNVLLKPQDKTAEEQHGRHSLYKGIRRPVYIQQVQQSPTAEHLLSIFHQLWTTTTRQKKSKLAEAQKTYSTLTVQQKPVRDAEDVLVPLKSVNLLTLDSHKSPKANFSIQLQRFDRLFSNYSALHTLNGGQKRKPRSARAGWEPLVSLIAGWIFPPLSKMKWIDLFFLSRCIISPQCASAASHLLKPACMEGLFTDADFYHPRCSPVVLFPFEQRDSASASTLSK